MLEENSTSLKKSNKIFAFLKISPAIKSPNLFGFLIGESVSFFGILPFGNLFFGGLAHHIGVANALFFGGTCCILGACFFARQITKIRTVVNPIYQEMGLLS
jgi:hypothetical protein